MGTLKNARKEGLEDFIKEHEDERDGALDKLDALIHKIAENKQDATPTKKQRPET